MSGPVTAAGRALLKRNPELAPLHVVGAIEREAVALAMADLRAKVGALGTWPRVQWYAYDAQVRGVPVNPTEDRVVVDRAAVIALIDDATKGAGSS